MANVLFGTNTNRHNFRLGDDQVDRIYLGDDRVWVNEITVALIAPSGWTLSQTTFTGVPGASSGGFTISRGGQGSLSRQTGSAASISVTSPGLSIGDGNPTVGGGVNNSISIPLSFNLPDNGGTFNLTVNGVTVTTYLRVVNVSPTQADANGGTGSSCADNPGEPNDFQFRARFNYSVTSGSTFSNSDVNISGSSSGTFQGGLVCQGDEVGAGNTSGNVSLQSITCTVSGDRPFDTGAGSFNASISIENSFLTGDSSIRTTDWDGDYGFAGQCGCPGAPGSVCFGGTLGGCGTISC